MKLSDFPIMRAVVESDGYTQKPHHMKDATWEHYVATRDARRRDRISRAEFALQMLAEAIEAGEINNARYKDTVKDRLNPLFDAMWDTVTKGISLYDRNDRMYKYTFEGQILTEAERKIYDQFSTLQPHHSVNAIAKIEKTGLDTPMIRAMLRVLNEFKPVAEGIAFLKNKTVKRQPKPPEDLKAKYSAPEASLRAIGQVRDILIQITQEAYDRLHQILVERYTGDVERYIARTNELRDLLPDGRISHLDKDALAQINQKRRILHDTLCVSALRDAIETIEDDQHDPYTGYFFKQVKLAPNADAVIQAVATRHANDCRDTFVYKNLVKLDSVFEAKGDFASVAIVGYEISLAGLEGTLRLTFKDGASFVVKNQVVFVENSFGTEFNRFPLTFHDVKLAGGVAMPRPSEERMNTVFVGKGE